MLDDSDTLLACPYNPSHRIQKSRLQTHLFKCRKNYPHMELRRCPYNANHDMDPADMMKHMTICPDRGSVEAHLVHTASERRPVVMPYVAPIMPPDEENWDTDETAHTYDPALKSGKEKILRGLQGATKSERKMHRAQERLRFTAVPEHGGCTGAVGGSWEGKGARPKTTPPARAPAATVATATAVATADASNSPATSHLPLRAPLAPSQTFAYPGDRVPKPDLDREFPALGRGRGRPH